jgi:hypothetical protein
MNHSLTLNSAMLMCALFLTGCATLFTGATTPVVLIDHPSDLRVVTSEGESLPIEQVEADIQSAYKFTAWYYYPGVEVDKQMKTHELTLSSSDGTATTNILLKPSGYMILGNLFTSGIIGLVVDARSKKWHVADNKYVDVPAVLNGTEPRSQRELRNYMRRDVQN